MKNSLIMDRARYNSILEDRSDRYHQYIHGIPGHLLQMLDYFVIIESDGSAYFIKNRFNGESHMSKTEFEEFSNNLTKLESFTNVLYTLENLNASELEFVKSTFQYKKLKDLLG